MNGEIRALFPGLKDTIYLNTATLSVGCAPAVEAYERAAKQWSAGRLDWLEAERAGEDARALFAQIVGAGPDEIALVPAVSIAAGIVAANLPPAKRGENIVVPARIQLELFPVAPASRPRLRSAPGAVY
jgi:selenocysteine lyase/cysteine desulfurase